MTDFPHRPLLMPAEPTELDRCLTALRLEVPAAVADDVTRIVRAAIAEARREGAAGALSDYADHIMADVAKWDERVYPNRWISARDKAASVRDRAAALRGDA